MSHYSQGEFDFVKRTLKILVQYEKKLTLPKSEKYEVTLFINCLMGLIVVPQQFWSKEMNDRITDYEKVIPSKKNISFIEDEYNFINVFRHLRNAAAHGQIKPISKEKGGKRNITHLAIKDYHLENKKKKRKTFEAELSVIRAKELAINIGKEMLKIMKDYR